LQIFYEHKRLSLFGPNEFKSRRRNDGHFGPTNELGHPTGRIDLESKRQRPSISGRDFGGKTKIFDPEIGTDPAHGNLYDFGADFAAFWDIPPTALREIVQPPATVHVLSIFGPKNAASRRWRCDAKHLQILRIYPRNDFDQHHLHSPYFGRQPNATRIAAAASGDAFFLHDQHVFLLQRKNAKEYWFGTWGRYQ